MKERVCAAMPNIRQAQLIDAATVIEILKEAAHWQAASGNPMWRDNEFAPGIIESDVARGLFHIAERNGEPAGVIRFQLEDPEFWPEMPAGDSAYVHRLAVKRIHAGTGISTALLRWAVERAQSIGRGFLRLDCEASRPRLRAIYERFGFSHHSDRQVGPYFVSRYELKIEIP